MTEEEVQALVEGYGAWNRREPDVLGDLLDPEMEWEPGFGALEELLAEAEQDPDIARNAPYTTPVRRLDEVAANKRPVVRQPL